MANMTDYLKWRGDLSLAQDPLNEIDNLVLARFSHMPFENLMKDGEKLKIKTLYERFCNMNIKNYDTFLKEDYEFFEALGESKRFGNLIALKHKEKMCKKIEEQFAAITVLLPEDTAFIVFRGTDCSILGWKENFNLGFMSHIPSQKDACEYLNYIGNHYKGNLILGGHSKGGNLAIYSACFCEPEIQKRIKAIYSNDGPGFNSEIIESKEYKKIIDKVTSFVPQSSVVGRLLFHEEKYYVVKSTQVGVLQHDPYSWQVEQNHFVKMEELTNGSQITEKTIKEWIEKVDPERRKIFVDTLYDILIATHAENVTDLGPNWIRTASRILKNYQEVDEESKEVITQTLEALKNATKEQILESIRFNRTKKTKRFGVLAKSTK